MANCPFQDPDDICKWLRDQIHKKVFQQKSQNGVRGLAERIMDQVYGRNGPMNADGSPNSSWVNHDTEIKNLRRNIQEHLKEHNDRGCGDRYPVSAAAKQWVRTANPRAQDWKGPVRSEVAEPGLFDLKYWENITGLTGWALIALLIVWQGSRLFPPRNLVPA